LRVLVLGAVVFRVVAAYGVIINLTHLHVWIDFERLDAHDFKGPVAFEPYVTEPCGHMDEHAPPEAAGHILFISLRALIADESAESLSVACL